MTLEFFNARNGQMTCSLDGRYLHSSFNPQSEAERFVKSLPHTFNPAAIIFVGACLPWCAHTLREVFPEAKLIAIQFDRAFERFSDDWDTVYYVTPADNDYSEAQTFLENSLFQELGEEKLVTSQFVSWKAAEAVWTDASKATWEALKSCMERAQSVLTTRNYFNVRWFKNTVHSLSAIKTFVIPDRTDMPVVVTASGPSLSRVLPFLEKNRHKYILVAASSSISTLLSRNIIPDYCISTDGGWYATRHLRPYQTDVRLKNVPLIISAESAVPSALFNTIPFVLLSYGDAIETILAEQINIPSVKGLRNGTVSGTAAAFAAGLTTGKVYIAGLDLAPGAGFQHAEPNENDVPLFSNVSRVHTIETSQAASRYNSGSLTIYREWFSTQNETFTSRIFRLLSKNDTLEKLGSMNDVYCEDLSFSDNSSHPTSIKTYPAEKDNALIIRNYLLSAASFIEKNSTDEKNILWYASLVLKQYVNYLRMTPDEQAGEISSLAENTARLIKEVANNV